MFIYAINSIRKLFILAQLVEQWTGNPEVGDSSPPSTFNFRMLTEFELISLIKPEVRKTLNINIFGYVNNIIIEL